MATNIQPVLKLLRRVVSGETFSRAELDAATWEASGRTDRMAQEAWIELRMWLADEDIRARDPDYEQAKLRRLKWLLEVLESEPALRR
jgi:hypothetical protein